MGVEPLGAHLRSGRDGGRKLFVPYVTGGLTAGWTDVLLALIAGGADAVEIGIPFSDPVMDGPTIQEASAAALARGTTPGSILADLRRVSTEVTVPLIAMTYVNVPFRMGARRFVAEIAEAGIGAVILPDLPMEELGEWRPAAEAGGIETVLLAGPITPDDRLRRLCGLSEGFVYGVNLMGVTGERSTLGEASAVLARRLKSVTDLPVLMGFGVSTPEQAVVVAAPADGVVVASALMRRVLDGAGPDDLQDMAAGFRSGLDAG